MTRPLLLIDVDGPLNPYARSNRQLRKDPQFTLYKLLGFPVGLARGHGEELLKLADAFELTWCTTWEHEANRLIGPKIGLPDLPVIVFPKSLSDHDVRVYFKTPTVIEYAAGRPFAWVDDEISQWDDQYVNKHHDGPAKLMKIDPATGLTQWHFDQLAAWAARLALEAGT